MDCNFEDDFCNWVNDTSGQRVWKRANGSLNAANTIYASGPNMDHTKMNISGYFAYSDTRQTHSFNDKFRLESPLIDPIEACFEFYYYMFGNDINSLNVYIKQNDQYGAPVWSRARNQGPQWLRGEVRLKNIQNKFKLVIEAVAGGYFSGIIAIDDTKLLQNCPTKSNRTCDFESEDICGYQIIASSDVTWKRSTASDLNEPVFGPFNDQ